MKKITVELDAAIPLAELSAFAGRVGGKLSLLPDGSYRISPAPAIPAAAATPWDGEPLQQPEQELVLCKR